MPNGSRKLPPATVKCGFANVVPLQIREGGESGVLITAGTRCELLQQQSSRTPPESDRPEAPPPQAGSGEYRLCFLRWCWLRTPTTAGKKRCVLCRCFPQNSGQACKKQKVLIVSARIPQRYGGRKHKLWTGIFPLSFDCHRAGPFGVRTGTPSPRRPPVTFCRSPDRLSIELRQALTFQHSRGSSLLITRERNCLFVGFLLKAWMEKNGMVWAAQNRAPFKSSMYTRSTIRKRRWRRGCPSRRAMNRLYSCGYQRYHLHKYHQIYPQMIGAGLLGPAPLPAHSAHTPSTTHLVTSSRREGVNTGQRRVTIHTHTYRPMRVNLIGGNPCLGTHTRTRLQDPAHPHVYANEMHTPLVYAVHHTVSVVTDHGRACLLRGDADYVRSFTVSYKSLHKCSPHIFYISLECIQSHCQVFGVSCPISPANHF